MDTFRSLIHKDYTRSLPHKFKMSIIGKIARGKKWEALAELSEYAKKNIEADPSMQEEIEFYKKSLEPTEVKAEKKKAAKGD